MPLQALALVTSKMRISVLTSIIPLVQIDPLLVEALLDAAFGEDRKQRTAYKVREGMGMGIFPVYSQHQFPDLVHVPDTPVTPDRSVWLLLHSDLRRTTRVRLLVDHIAAEFTALRASFQTLAHSSSG